MPEDKGMLQNLEGEWRLATDPENRGREERWFAAVDADAKEAPVPGLIQQVFPAYHGVAWYWHAFKPAAAPQRGQRALLRFGMVDYLAEVWLNGRRVGEHEGGETPFELDVTSAIRPAAENLLAVRVINPHHEPIEGVTLKETPHRNKAIPHRCGSSYNYGGILMPVQLAIVPAVRVAGVFVRPDVQTGRVRVSVTVQNDTGKAATGEIEATVGPADAGEVQVASKPSRANLPVGQSVHELSLHIAQPRLWSLDDPFLYVVAVRVRGNGLEHERRVRCGFRDFRVVGGYFYLNGKRVFVRSTHTGNHFPMGQVVPQDHDLVRRDLVIAKACGFNMVRFIAGVAYPEQLDFCDEIGLMVYEENLASWCLEDSPHMARRYDLSVREMILRDRNHPSVTIWGMLNETTDGPVFRHAADALSLVRSLDDTRLVLLGSGRWDCQWNIGSVSNPGSDRWEHEWGAEAPDATPTPFKWQPMKGGYFDRAGDAHLYPPVPHPPEIVEFIRTLGRDTKPVFLSEYGIGSQMNVIRESRRYEQAGARADLEDAALMRSMAERLEADWQRLGMKDAYPFAEDMLRESQRLHCRQRLLGFDAIRSNPRLCGFNVTGMLDHGITGEGLWTFFREWKPGIADALKDGWAPLRWCLFVSPIHGYVGRTITLEAVLANEDVLPPGRYSVRLRVWGPDGEAWRKDVTLRIPAAGRGAAPPLAVPVLRTQARIRGPAGKYTFAAEMDGAAPAGGRLDFNLDDAAQMPRLTGRAAVWGVSPKARRWLERHGLRCQRFGASSPGRRQVILVGDVSAARSAPDLWRHLAERVARGDVAVFLSPAAFREGDNATRWLPLVRKGKCYQFGDWLYHKQCVARPHPVFDGLLTGCMDFDYYDQVVGHWIFEDIDTPDDVAAAAFSPASYAYAGGYGCGVLVGAYDFGHGRFVLNAFEILSNLDANPAADRMLINLVRYAQQHTSGPLRKLPADFVGTLKEIGYKS